MVPKTPDELRAERLHMAARRRTARWCFAIAMAAYAYWAHKQQHAKRKQLLSQPGNMRQPPPPPPPPHPQRHAPARSAAALVDEFSRL